jgi:hypothetical protein
MADKFNTNETPVTSVKLNYLTKGHYTTAERDAIPTGDTIKGMLIYNTDDSVYQELTQVSPAIWRSRFDIGILYDVEFNDEITAPAVQVYKTLGVPFNMKLVDSMLTLTTAGTGVALFEIDVLMENGADSGVFATIYSTRPSTDASKFTSDNATTPPVFSVSSLIKGRRLQFKVAVLDTDLLARGVKCQLIGYRES